MSEIASYIINRKLVKRTKTGRIRIGSQEIDRINLAHIVMENREDFVSRFGEQVLLQDFEELRHDIEAYYKELDQLEGNNDSIYQAMKEVFPFYWYAKPDGQQVYYKLLTPSQNYMVLPVINQSVNGIINAIRADKDLLTRYTEFWRSNYPDKTFDWLIQQIVGSWSLDPDKGLDAEPDMITWDNTKVAFKYFNPASIREGATPAWDQWLARLSYPDIFMAWVWSIFDPSNKGRQALWVHGGGFDGKSTVARAIQRIFGDIGSTSISQNAYHSQFFFSNVYGKRLAIYGDCKNSQVIKSEKIHSLLGGDIVSVEAKGEQAFMGKVFAKLLILSNVAPLIDTRKTNEITRILYMKVKKPDSEDGSLTWEDELVEEKDAFLYRCRESYAALCPSGVEIKMPESMVAELDSVNTDISQDVVEKFVETQVDAEETSQARISDIMRVFKKYAKEYGVPSDKIEYLHSDLRSRLSEKKGMQVIRRGGAIFYGGIRLRSEFSGLE